MRKYILERNTKRWLSILSSALDFGFIAALSIGLYFAAFFPIYNTVLSQDVALETSSREEITNIGTSSKLMHLQADSTSVYSLDNSYKYFVRTLLRYSYEGPLSTYDMEEDADGYKSKEEEMHLFPLIKDGEYFDDDFLGYFYTKFSPEKRLESEIVNPKEHYVVDILGVDKEALSSEFYETPALSTYPILNAKTRSSLFSYHVLKVFTGDLSNIDRAFYSAFVKNYEDAGNLLLQYEPYKNAFDAYDQSYSKLLTFKVSAAVMSFLVSEILLLGVVTLFTPLHGTLGQWVFKRASLDDEEQYRAKNHFLRVLTGLLRYFPSIIPLCIFIDLNVLFASLGALPISLFLICVLCLALDLVSTMLLLVKKEPRSLFDLLCGTYTYRYFIDYRD